MLSQYWILNSAKLIEHADMRKSVKYLFPKNIIFQRAVREDKESYVLNMNSLSEREYTSAPFSRAPPRAADKEPGPRSRAVINTPNKSSGSWSS